MVRPWPASSKRMFSLTRRAGSSPAARVVAGVAATSLALAGCQKEEPPRLTDADLRSVFTMDVLGEVPKGQALDKLFTGDPSMCIDLHHGRTAFAGYRYTLSNWDKAKLDLGLDIGLVDWDAAAPTGQKPIDSILDYRLKRAERRAILRVARAPESDLIPPSPKPWPKRCELRSWFGSPVYEGRFAFIETGYSCGGLCGAGSILALEYSEGRWRLVAKKASWLA